MTDIKDRKSVIQAILVLNSNAKVVVRGDDDIDNCEIEWLDGTTPITKENIKVDLTDIILELGDDWLINLESEIIEKLEE